MDGTAHAKAPGMSTRSNILVLNGSSRIFLYRHCDGYPAENGADLCEAIAASKNAADLLVNLLSRRYEKASYETVARPVYEVTSDWHSDIEWAYVIEFTSYPTTVRVGWQAIGFRGVNRERALAALDCRSFEMHTPAEFGIFVQTEKDARARGIAAIEAARAAEGV